MGHFSAWYPIDPITILVHVDASNQIVVDRGVCQIVITLHNKFSIIALQAREEFAKRAELSGQGAFTGLDRREGETMRFNEMPIYNNIHMIIRQSTRGPKIYLGIV